MKQTAMIFLSFLFALFSTSAIANISAASDPGPVKKKSAINKIVLLQVINEARKKGCQCGDTWYPSVPPLTWNDVLEKAAQRHSNDMFQNKFFSHVSPDGTKAGVRIDVAGYRWQTYGENIAMGYGSEKEVVAGWLKSPGHCKNIMNKDFKEMGVAKAGSYWTQDFGARH